MKILTGRPTNKDKELIEERNKRILESLKYFTQAEVAKIFRLPRNTINKVKKKHG